jgi:hypothetical protein
MRLFTVITSALMGCALLTSCAHPKPEPLPADAGVSPVQVAEATAARLEGLPAKYLVPAGRYLPVMGDAQGVYFACPSGLVIHVQDRNIDQYSRVAGGVFLPKNGAPPRLWIVAAGMAASRGDRNLASEKGRRLGNDCLQDEENALLGGRGATIVTTVNRAGPTNSRVITGDLMGGSIAGAIVTTIINEGGVVFPSISGWGKSLIIEH